MLSTTWLMFLAGQAAENCQLPNEQIATYQSIEAAYVRALILAQSEQMRSASAAA